MGFRIVTVMETLYHSVILTHSLIHSFTHSVTQSISVVSLDNQATSNMTSFPTQSHYPDIELTSPCHVLGMLNTRLASNKCQFQNQLAWFGQVFELPIFHMGSLHSTDFATVSGQPHVVNIHYILRCILYTSSNVTGFHLLCSSCWFSWFRLHIPHTRNAFHDIIMHN